MDRVILTASGGMVYTNGISGGKVVYIAEGETADGWYEVSEETFVQMLENGVSINEATQEDYQAALREFGVEV